MGDNLTEIVTHLALQLAVILFAAKLAAEVCERYLKIPPVLGELVAGITMGPYALGGLPCSEPARCFPALSGTTLARRLEEPLRGVYNALVAIFFVVMGMMVDVSSMMGALAFGGAITAAAILTKVVGAGLPALATGFNLRRASRIGIGMLPRGEVALIVAGIGLARGVVAKELFGVAILMTVVTTLMAPPILVALFARGGDGRRRAVKEAEDE